MLVKFWFEEGEPMVLKATNLREYFGDAGKRLRRRFKKEE